jgi:hypothetical protein
VLVTAEPARTAKVEVPASDTVAIAVVCMGITDGFAGSVLSFLHPAIKTTTAIEAIARDVNSLFVFIFSFHKL